MNALISHPWIRLIVMLIMAAVSVLFLAQDSSPLYKDAGYDYDMFVMGGEFVRRGFTLYVDYFDNKGPYLFFINALGLSLVPGKWGIYILEVANWTVVFALLYQLGKALNVTNRANWLAISASLLVMIVNMGGGDTVEGWSLPWVLLPLVLATRFTTSGRKHHNPWWSYLYGLSFGIVSMLRINNGAVILGIGIALSLYVIRIGEWRQLLINISSAIAGVLSGIMPGLIYALSTHSLPDMYYAIFYYAFRYKDPAGWFGYRALVHNFIALLPCLLLTLVAWKGERRLFTLMMSISAVTFLTFISGNYYYHYFLMVIPITYVATALAIKRFKGFSRVMVITAIILPQLAMEMDNVIDNIKLIGIRSTIDTQSELRKRILASIPENGRDSIYQFEIDSEHWGLVYHSGHLPVGRYIGQQWFHINTESRYAKDRITESFTNTSPRYVVTSMRPGTTPFASMMTGYEVIDSVKTDDKYYLILHKKNYIFTSLSLNKFIHYGIYCEAGGGVNLQFGGDVASMCHDGINRNIKSIGNFLVGKPLDNRHYHITLTRGKVTFYLFFILGSEQLLDCIDNRIGSRINGNHRITTG